MAPRAIGIAGYTSKIAKIFLKALENQNNAGGRMFSDDGELNEHPPDHRVHWRGGVQDLEIGCRKKDFG
jgi:hypothetical protein